MTMIKLFHMFTLSILLSSSSFFKQGLLPIKSCQKSWSRDSLGRIESYRFHGPANLFALDSGLGDHLLTRSAFWRGDNIPGKDIFWDEARALRPMPSLFSLKFWPWLSLANFRTLWHNMTRNTWKVSFAHDQKSCNDRRERQSQPRNFLSVIVVSDSSRPGPVPSNKW
jgi:hypothetical protein